MSVYRVSENNLSLIVNQGDPTRTTQLRKQFGAFLRAMWNALGADVRGFVATAQLTRAEVAQFEQFVRLRMAAHLRGVTFGQRTVDGYIYQAYLRGIRQASADMKQIASDGQDERSLITQLAFSQELSHIQDDYTRSLDTYVDSTVAGLTGAYSASTRNETGKPETLALLLLLITQRGINSTNAMAPTAIVDAYNAALLTRYETLGIKLVIPIPEVQFTTAGDGRVCQRCKSIASTDNGRGPGVFTISDARGVIPVHPRCRCRWSPLSL